MTQTTKQTYKSAPIFPDGGAGYLSLRATFDDVIRTIGAPIERTEVMPKDPRLSYTPIIRHKHAGITLLMLRGVTIHQIAITQGYEGKTADGIGIGTPMTSVIKKWGKGSVNTDNSGPETWTCDKHKYTSIIPYKDQLGVIRVETIIITDLYDDQPENIDPFSRSAYGKEFNRGFVKHAKNELMGTIPEDE